jgi:hypothetical protein
LKLRKVSAHRFEDQLNGHFWLRQCNQHSPLCAGYIAGFTRLNSVLAYPLFCLGDLRVAEVESVVAKELRRASTGSVSRNWSPAGLDLQPLLASWVWLAVQSTGCSKKRAAAVQGGDVRSGAERHDKLAARPLWNLSTHVAELETRACTGCALLPARGRAKSRRESGLSFAGLTM